MKEAVKKVQSVSTSLLYYVEHGDEERVAERLDELQEAVERLWEAEEAERQ